MKSIEIYQNIAENDSKNSYNFLKKRFLNLIKRKYTVNDCINEAEDRFAFAFLKLYEVIKAENLKNAENMVAYFLKICKNDFLHHSRRSKIDYCKSLNEDFIVEDPDFLNLLDIEHTANTAIKSLPKQLQKICSKIYLEDRNQKETAQELSIDYQHIRKYNNKAIGIIRAKINPSYRELLFVA
jgi:RNA polymerase sigma factor (sigma-70 family)